MSAHTYYVTVQDEDGAAIGGRLLLEMGAPFAADTVRNEAGHLVWDLLKDLWAE